MSSSSVGEWLDGMALSEYTVRLCAQQYQTKYLFIFLSIYLSVLHSI